MFMLPSYRQEYYPVGGLVAQCNAGIEKPPSFQPYVQEPASQAGNAYIINLDEYSDGDSDGEPALPPAIRRIMEAKAAAQTGSGSTTQEPGKAATADHSTGCAPALKLPPWRSEQHQAPRAPDAMAKCGEIAEKQGSEAAKEVRSPSDGSTCLGDCTDSQRSSSSDIESDPSPTAKSTAASSDMPQQKDDVRSGTDESEASEREMPPPEALIRPEPQAPKKEQAASTTTRPSPNQGRLQISATSWVSQQQARRKRATEKAEELSEQELERRIKSLLNKLTIEKFSHIFDQITTSGITKVSHVELFIREVFEKATGQHHFIEMYADLCVQMQEHLKKNPIQEDQTGTQFKKLLLNQCQSSFERNLSPPDNLAALRGDERHEAEVEYKMSMLGNIKLVGALFKRKMLASKVFVAIADELLADPTTEALESLAALLSIVGGVFDRPDWPYHVALRGMFGQVRTLSESDAIERRVQCLLKDVLDLRKNGWQDRKPKKLEGPSKLKTEGKAMESLRGGKPSTPMMTRPTKPAVVKAPRQQDTSASRGPSRLACWDSGVKPAAAGGMKASVPEPTPVKKQFDQKAFKTEVARTLEELQVSHDVKDAAQRIGEASCPVEYQADEFVQLLEHTAQLANADTRRCPMKLLVALFADAGWSKQALQSGLRTFLSDVCPDLCIDVPSLPGILREELHPNLEPLVAKGLLPSSQRDELMKMAA